MTFPVESVIPALRDSLTRNRTVVLSAPTGSGKTTHLPLALKDLPFLRGRKILMLEPRRLAARACASFMARQLGERVGETVGFHVRLERKVSARTRLEIVTEGLLTQRLIADPELKDVALIIFDEFHERSLACDLGLAMALDVRHVLRDDLRLMIMSATLETASIAQFLGDADVHLAQGRMFPVETRYLQVSSSAPISALAAGAVRRLLNETVGDMLVFLPGEGEIRHACEALRDLPPNIDVLPLYGALAKDVQDDVLSPARAGHRKVVVATSIAETSLTIPGVRVVIDSGLMRVSRFSPTSGMSRLETLRLTRDRADQRCGRAGRTAPGICLRLWTAQEDRLLLPAMKSEILEADLTAVVLTAALWGTTSATGLPWLTPPPSGAWDNAVALLRLLGALDEHARITEMGRQMAHLGVHPRLANMILRCPCEEATLLAAIVEELPNGGPRHETDLRSVVDFVRERVSPAFSARVMELARRWLRLLPVKRTGALPIGEMLCFAFPDRIGHNRGNGTFQLTLGRGAFLDRTDALAHEPYLVCCNLDDREGDARILLAAPVQEEAITDIFASQIVTETLTHWDRREACVKAIEVRRLNRMVLQSLPLANPDAALVTEALLAGIRQKGVDALAWPDSAQALRHRILFLRRTLGEDWPDVSADGLSIALEDAFAPFVQGMTRWSHLEKLDFLAILDAILARAGKSRRDVDRLAPQKMPVPSTSLVTIHYDAEFPYAAVRLQECFGLQSTPLVAGVPVVIHLLSPAGRPVQITRDLAGFWRDTYALVRKDLRGRYPKHYWPEDPLTAIATRRVRPK